MPRAGSGGGGSHSSGGHSSGGHSSSSHSSGGHHVSSSRPSSSSHSRAGSGSSFGGGSHHSGGGFGGGPHPGGGGFGGGPRPTPPRPPRTPIMPPPRRRHTYYGGGGGCLSSILAIFTVVIIIIIAAVSCTAGSEYHPDTNKTAVSTVSREKLTTSGSFDSNCIVDELDWFDNVKSAGKSLKTFYDKTGVQPYVVLLSYNASLTNDASKEEYAENYYNNNINNEDTFLFVYFAEKNQDDDVGYMCYVGGNNTRSVMDSEAVEIFWEYIDDYWYSDLSTDELFETVFTKTANSIMATSTSASNDSSSKIGKIIRNILLIAVVIIVAVFIAKKFNKKSDGGSSSEASNDTTTKDNPNILN